MPVGMGVGPSGGTDGPHGSPALLAAGEPGPSQAPALHPKWSAPAWASRARRALSPSLARCHRTYVATQLVGLSSTSTRSPPQLPRPEVAAPPRYAQGACREGELPPGQVGRADAGRARRTTAAREARREADPEPHPPDQPRHHRQLPHRPRSATPSANGSTHPLHWRRYAAAQAAHRTARGFPSVSHRAPPP